MSQLVRQVEVVAVPNRILATVEHDHRQPVNDCGIRVDIRIGVAVSYDRYSASLQTVDEFGPDRYIGRNLQCCSRLRRGMFDVFGNLANRTVGVDGMGKRERLRELDSLAQESSRPALLRERAAQPCAARALVCVADAGTAGRARSPARAVPRTRPARPPRATRPEQCWPLTAFVSPRSAWLRADGVTPEAAETSACVSPKSSRIATSRLPANTGETRRAASTA